MTPYIAPWLWNSRIHEQHIKWLSCCMQSNDINKSIKPTKCLNYKMPQFRTPKLAVHLHSRVFDCAVKITDCKLNYVYFTRIQRVVSICKWNWNQYGILLVCNFVFPPSILISTQHPSFCWQISTQHHDTFHPASHRKTRPSYPTF